MLRNIHRAKLKGILLGVIMSVLFLITLVVPVDSAVAEESGTVRLAVQPGLSGLYKMGLPVGLNITISNQGQAFNGLLVVELEKGHEAKEPMSQNAHYQKVIQVPGKSLFKTTLMLPSEVVNQGAKVVLLTDGKAIAQSSIQGTAVSGGFIVLSLGEKPLQGGIGTWLDQNLGGQTAIKYLAPEYLPEDPLELVMADIIIVDDLTINQLKEPQIKLLKNWVSLGGMLLLSGGAGAEPDGPMADISPVKFNKQTTVSADLQGIQKVPGTVALRTGPLNEGEVLTKVRDGIIVAARNYGKGRVIYSGIALEQLTSEATRIWSLMFGQGQGSGQSDVKMQAAQEKRQVGSDRLGNAASYLPQLKTPPVPQVVLAWLVYVVVVGPGLYLLLKRYDRRDWLWWLIPTCAMITTGIVYLMAPAQRIHTPISQTLAVIEIMDHKRAEINATAAFVSPYGGTLQVEGSQDALILPSNYNYSSDQKTPIIQYSDTKKPSVIFPNVEYWSMRQARATVFKNDLGSIEGSLVLEDGYLKGRLYNNTSMNLRDCKVLLGGRILSIDRLPAGGQADINQSLAKWPGSLGPNEFRDTLVPVSKPGQVDIYVREREMADSVLNETMNTPNNQPVFYGWTDESLDLFRITDHQKDDKSYSLGLVTQALSLDLARGQRVELPEGMYIPKMIESKGASNQNPMGYTLYEGQLTLGIDLMRPLKKENCKVVSIHFSPQANRTTAVKIYDWQEKKWQNVPLSGLKLGPEEFKRYGSGAGEFRFQYEKIAGIGQPERIDLPAITVEGGVSQ